MLNVKSWLDNEQIEKGLGRSAQCHNRTFNGSGPTIVRGTHPPTTNELSQFVLASPTAKRRMFEPLTSVLREGFRKRGQREIFERDVI